MSTQSRLRVLERRFGTGPGKGDLEYHHINVDVESTNGVERCQWPEHAGQGCLVTIARGFGLPDGRNRAVVLEGRP